METHFLKMVGGYYKPDSKEAASAALFGNAYDFYDAYTNKQDAEAQSKMDAQMQHRHKPTKQRLLKPKPRMKL